MWFNGRAVGAGTLLLAGLLLAGCADSAPQSSIGLPTDAPASSAASSLTATPDLCAATAELQRSIAALRPTDLVTQGADAGRQALQQVQHDLTGVTDAATTQGAVAAAKVKTDIASLRTALAAARSTPSTSTIASLRTEARQLAADARTLSGKVTSGCPS